MARIGSISLALALAVTLPVLAQGTTDNSQAIYCRVSIATFVPQGRLKIVL